MNLLVADALLATVAAVISVTAIVSTLCWRTRERRLRALARPVHELRGSLTALELALATLERDPPTVHPRRVADVLRTQLERAKLALSDVDRCRAADGSGAEPPPCQVELSALVLSRTRAWSKLSTHYGARLDADWRAGPVRLNGHAGRLGQALDNLVVNALEHGGGRVVVVGERDRDTVKLRIADGGRGLGAPPEQVAEASWRSRRGHGLAIARDVVEAHGGRLSLALEGNGFAVVVELPLIAQAVPSRRRLTRSPRHAGRDHSPHADSGAPRAA